MIRKAALIATVTLLQALSAQAAETMTHPYTAHATPGNTAIWVINESTGEIAQCEFQGYEGKAVCNPSTPPNPKGSYGMIASDDLLTAWRVNRLNGAVSLCEYKSTEKPPVCSPWNK